MILILAKLPLGLGLRFKRVNELHFSFVWGVLLPLYLGRLASVIERFRNCLLGVLPMHWEFFLNLRGRRLMFVFVLIFGGVFLFIYVECCCSAFAGFWGVDHHCMCWVEGWAFSSLRWACSCSVTWAFIDLHLYAFHFHCSFTLRPLVAVDYSCPAMFMVLEPSLQHSDSSVHCCSVESVGDGIGISRSFSGVRFTWVLETAGSILLITGASLLNPCLLQCRFHSFIHWRLHQPLPIRLRRPRDLIYGPASWTAFKVCSEYCF
jgi:hypothetical protein